MQIPQIQYSRPIIPHLFKGVKHDEVKWTINYLLTLLESPEIPEAESKSTEPIATTEHTAWVQSMAKFRRLQPVDDKEATQNDAAVVEEQKELKGKFIQNGKLVIINGAKKTSVAGYEMK